MNLKHLKFKKEALMICDLALQKQGPVATKWIQVSEKNTLFKLWLGLYVDLVRAQAKQNKIVRVVAKKTQKAAKFDEVLQTNLK